MLSVHPQYVIDENQQRRAVLLTAEEWDGILEELEELDDIRAYDRAKRRKSDPLPLEQALTQISGRKSR